MNTTRVAIIALLSVGLLSVSFRAPAPTHEPALEPLAAQAAEATEVAARIDAKLTELNRHLAPSQVVRIRDAILRSSERHQLDPFLLIAMMKVESTGNPAARSPKGALGLMQVMPYMIGPMDLAGNPSTIEANIEASASILSGNIRRLGEEDGISAYFWGSDIRGTGYLDRVKNAREWSAREVRS